MIQYSVSAVISRFDMDTDLINAAVIWEQDLKAVSFCFTNWFYDKYPLKNIALTPLLAMQAMWDLMFSV
jgi:hypothetical protein